MGRKPTRAPYLKASESLKHPPGSMRALLPQFAEWIEVRGLSPATRQSRGYYVLGFIEWSEERGIARATDVTKQILYRYQRWLYHYRTASGKPMGFSSQYTRLVAVRTFFRWLNRYNHILFNPAADLDLPKVGRRLPKHVLNAQETETILNLANPAEPLGLRDRAILETLYSTGMRRKELVELRLYDVDAERGTIRIRLGKGKAERIIPIGERALAWVDKYTMEVRPRLLADPDETTLFLTNRGEPMRPQFLGYLVRDYLERAGLPNVGACHLFRHTMATLMLENGADIRFVQAMLGHASIETTQVYTHVAIRTLKEIHTATHPAKLRKQENAAQQLQDVEEPREANAAQEHASSDTEQDPAEALSSF